MFVGHLGAGLVLRAYEPRINAGVLVFAALFPDVLLWLLVLAGVEQVHVPDDFATRHYMTFTFPWSHSLVASVVWSALGFGVTWSFRKDVRCAAMVAEAVFSHFLLDWIVHPAELPVLGPSSPQLGLGLWDALGLALLIEFVLAMSGLSFYLAGTHERWQARRVGMAVLLFSMTGMAIWGQLSAKEAPPAAFAAISSLVTIGVICAIMVALDRGVTSSDATTPR